MLSSKSFMVLGLSFFGGIPCSWGSWALVHGLSLSLWEKSQAENVSLGT